MSATPTPRSPSPLRRSKPSDYDPTIRTPSTRGSGATHPGPAEWPAEATAAPASARFGKFIRTRRLGAGGMGEVWKAWDMQLSRWVALKFLKGFEDEDVARFEREARTAGGLNHPNIAAVHEVGAAQGRRYIAMQYIEGRTLKGFPRNDLTGLVKLMRAGALALHHAHEHGVLHRDLKPDNLMVVSRPGGSPGQTQHHLYVMDFGLARTAGGPSELSHAGQIVGTPAYMSPEQARGAALDARSDVYSLGATFYELLTGKRPLIASGIHEMLRKVQEEDPASLRSLDARIDADLEGIVLKCLEKDPAARYAGADEMARDLERWLDGEPVAARAGGASWRVRRRILRKRGPWIAATAGGVALIVLPALLLPQLFSARESSREQLRRRTDTALAAALEVRRAGGKASALERFVRDTEEACAEASKAFPNSAEPHYRLGRIHRLRMDEPAALAAQDRALALEPAYAPSQYERATLLGRAYLHRTRELERRARRDVGRTLWARGGGRVRPGDVAGAARGATLAMQDPAARDLARRIAADADALVAGGAPGPGEASCVRGWKALTEGKLQEAAARFEEAISAAPELEEAYEALADLARDRRDYAGAVRWLDRVLERDRGLLSAVNDRGDAHLFWGVDLRSRGEDPDAHLEAARLDFAAALSLDPGRPDSLLGLGIVRFVQAYHAMGTGRDPTPHYEASVGELTTLLGAHPNHVEGRGRRGQARLDWGRHIEDQGGDPSEHYRQALADFDRTLEMDVEDRVAWEGRACVLAGLGSWEMNRGRDPEANFRQAMDAFERALKLDPSHAETWARRGGLRINRALRAVRTGADPARDYEEAVGDFEGAIRLDATLDDGWFGRGFAKSNWAAHAFEAGKDPTELATAAIADFDRALQLNPSRGESRVRRAGAIVTLARYRMAAGLEAASLFARAVSDLDDAIRANPTAAAFEVRASAMVTWGTLDHQQQRDPGPKYAAGIVDLDRALRLEPGKASILSARGLARSNWGAWKGQRGEEGAEELLRVGAEDFGLAVAAGGGLDPLLRRAGLLQNWGNARFQRGLDPSEQYAASVADFEAAARLQPGIAGTQAGLASTLRNWGVSLQNSKSDPSEKYRLALEADSRALEIDPRCATAWRGIGETRYNWGLYDSDGGRPAKEHFRAALQAYEKAVEINPALAPSVAARTAASRQRLGP